MILALAIFCKLVISLISSLSAVLKGKKDMKKDSRKCKTGQKF
jgi:hypothetical protein